MLKKTLVKGTDGIMDVSQGRFRHAQKRARVTVVVASGCSVVLRAMEFGLQPAPDLRRSIDGARPQ